MRSSDCGTGKDGIVISLQSRLINQSAPAWPLSRMQPRHLAAALSGLMAFIQPDYSR
jgi:hypothetical protein